MKKVIAIILIFLIPCTLCACGSNETVAPSSKDIFLELPNNGKKGPSETTIQEDLLNALKRKNPNAALTETETVKSLTGNDSYQITLQAMAQSTYADFQYQADMFYTKYDQGWILDNLTWSAESYEIVRTPDVDTMVEYAGAYLLGHQIIGNYRYAEYMTPMLDAVIQYSFNEEVGKMVLELSWNAIEPSLNSEVHYLFTSLWTYNPDSDSWVLLSNNNCDFYIDDEYVDEVSNCDLTGSWVLKSAGRGSYYAQLEISNFSWDGFDAVLSGYIDSPTHFVLETTPPTQLAYDYTFTNGTAYLAVDFQGSHTYLFYFTSNTWSSYTAFADITDELPLLP